MLDFVISEAIVFLVFVVLALLTQPLWKDD